MTNAIRVIGLPLALTLLVAGTAMGQAGGGGQRPPAAPPQPPAPVPDREPVMITGRVIAPGAARLPENADVRIETAGGTLVSFAYTDAVGRFEFRDVELSPAEFHYLVVEAPGFEIYKERLDYQVDRRRGGFVSVALSPERLAAADTDDGALRVVDLGQLLAEIPEEARREYERALEEVNDGDHQEAAERLERVVALAPDFYDGYDALGAAYLSIGRHSEAEAALGRALELGPGAVRPLLNLGALSYQVGEAHLQESRFEEAGEAFVRAIGFLEEAIRREPTAALAHQHLGSALYRVGQYEGAESSLHEALRLNPALEDVRLILINVYTRQQRYDDALEQLDTWVDDNPRSDRLSALERLRGQIEAARRH